MPKNSIQLLLMLLVGFSIHEKIEAKVAIEMSEKEYDEFRASKNGQGPGCLQTMLQSTSEGMAATLQAQANESTALLGLSKEYYEKEQKCGNDLAEVMMELNRAKADHEEKLLKLPTQIEMQKLEHEEALLQVKQECEQSSGGAFKEWKQMVSQGVITPERGGPMALFSRGENVNRYQKLFYDDCLASKNNIKRVDLLARKLSLNVRMVRDGIDASAQKLAALSKNLSFKQGMIVENCMKAEKQLDYQAALVRSNAAATNSATKMNNFMRMLNGVNVCMKGPGGAINDTTGAGTNSNTTN